MEGGTTLTTAVSDFMGVVSTIMTTIKGDPYLILYLVAPVVGIAIAAVRKLVGRYQSAGVGFCKQCSD